MPVLPVGPEAGPASASTCAPWASALDVCSPCNGDDFPPDLLDLGLQMASDVLFNFTGRRWPGVCTDEVRPTSCGCGERGGWWVPAGVELPAVSVDEHSMGPGLCGCGCWGVSEVKLPGYPVVAINEVMIDGQVVDPSSYRVDDRRRLVFQRSAGRAGWPCCQRLDLPAGEDGTWSVNYDFGGAPPPGGVNAAASLGCQLSLACSPDADVAGKCRLPKRVTSITRQGVSMAVLDPLTLFRDGWTGLPEVDLWVASILKGDSRRRATVFVPGRRGAARRTTG